MLFLHMNMYMYIPVYTCICTSPTLALPQVYSVILMSNKKVVENAVGILIFLIAMKI